MLVDCATHLSLCHYTTDEPVLLPGPYDGQPTVVTDATQVKVVNTLPEDALGAESVEMNTKV